jgi:hypothetical protein
MDALGSIKPVVSAPVPVKAAAVLPKPVAIQASAPLVGSNATAVPGLDTQLVEAKRQEVLVNAARNAPQPLGSQIFTMYKDATGQVITRFRDTNSGRVTYIPEPQLLRIANSGNGAQSLLNIKV